MRNYSLKKLLLTEVVTPEGPDKVIDVYHLTGQRPGTGRPEVSVNYDEEYRHERTRHERTKDILKSLRKGEAEREVKRKESTREMLKDRTLSILGDLWTKGTGFKAGLGNMYGFGAYTCYELNPTIARFYGNEILKFKVPASNFLVFVESEAKAIHGDRYRLEDQFDDIYSRNKDKYDEICRRRNINSDSNEASADILRNFRDYLVAVSDDPHFIGSTTENKQRTAPLCMEALIQFSRLTTSSVKLKEIIDGVMFAGWGDGPVCAVYNAPLLKLDKVGLLNEDGQAEYFDSHAEITGAGIDISFEDLNHLYDSGDIDNDDFIRDQEERIFDAHQRFSTIRYQRKVDIMSQLAEVLDKVFVKHISSLESPYKSFVIESIKYYKLDDLFELFYYMYKLSDEFGLDYVNGVTPISTWEVLYKTITGSRTPLSLSDIKTMFLSYDEESVGNPDVEFESPLDYKVVDEILSNPERLNNVNSYIDRIKPYKGGIFDWKTSYTFYDHDSNFEKEFLSKIENDFKAEALNSFPEDSLAIDDFIYKRLNLWNPNSRISAGNYINNSNIFYVIAYISGNCLNNTFTNAKPCESPDLFDEFVDVSSCYVAFDFKNLPLDKVKQIFLEDITKALIKDRSEELRSDLTELYEDQPDIL